MDQRSRARQFREVLQRAKQSLRNQDAEIAAMLDGAPDAPLPDSLIQAFDEMCGPRRRPATRPAPLRGLVLRA